MSHEYVFKNNNIFVDTIKKNIRLTVCYEDLTI